MIDHRIKQTLIDKIDNGEIRTYFQLKIFLDINGLELDKSILRLLGYDYYIRGFDLLTDIVENHSDIDEYFKDDVIITGIIEVHGRHLESSNNSGFKSLILLFDMKKIFVPLFRRRPGILINYYLNNFENKVLCEPSERVRNNFMFFEGMLVSLLNSATRINMEYRKYLNMVEMKREEIYKKISYLK